MNKVEQRLTNSDQIANTERVQVTEMSYRFLQLILSDSTSHSISKSPH